MLLWTLLFQWDLNSTAYLFGILSVALELLYLFIPARGELLQYNLTAAPTHDCLHGQGWCFVEIRFVILIIDYPKRLKMNQ